MTKPKSKSLPAELSTLLHDIQADLPSLLKGNLVGIYLHGSATQKSFNPKRSDVDVIVVTHRNLSDAQFRRVDAWLAEASCANPWTRRLQMPFLIRGEVLKMNSRACLYQFGDFHRTGSDGNPIIWMDVMKNGIVLYGPRADSFVPPIGHQILWSALKREVHYLREEFCEKPDSPWRDVRSYRSYAVLTLCRILYSSRHGTIVSKPGAGAWAIKRLPKGWEKMIRQALEIDEGRSRRSISRTFIVQFIEFVERQIAATEAADRSDD